MQLPALFIVTLAIPAFASQPVPRAYYAGGGFALISSSCPTGTDSLACGTCCPPGFELETSCGSGNDGTACCPIGSSCSEALTATPFCADSTWVLWNTTSGNLFCCLSNQIGTQSQQCVSDLTNVVATLSADKLGQPVPTGAAGSTIAGSDSSSASATGTSVESTKTGTGAKTGKKTATGTSGASVTGAVVVTTTKGGIASVVTSLLGDATSKSDSSAVRPLGGELVTRPWTFGVGCLITALLGLVAFAARAS